MAQFSTASKSRMIGLHPDLIRVLNRTILTYDFSIIQGVRTKEECYINWGKGRTITQCEAVGIPNPSKYAQPNLQKVTWLNHPLSSNHLPKTDGYGHAVDCTPYPVDWQNISAFAAMAKVMLDAAKQENVNLKWGGDWSSSKDYPHFELA